MAAMSLSNTELIAKHIKPEKGKEIGICKVCGQKTKSGFKSKLYIKDARFTNFDLLKVVGSDIICQNCASCLSEPKLRRSSFIADADKIIYLQKNDIENYVFNLSETGIKTPFVFCVTESFKKHMSFKATTASISQRDNAVLCTIGRGNHVSCIKDTVKFVVRFLTLLTRTVAYALLIAERLYKIITTNPHMQTEMFRENVRFVVVCLPTSGKNTALIVC